VFEQLHEEMLVTSVRAAATGTDELDGLARGFDAFLDAVLEPELQRIVIIDAPAVLGLARFIELDERHALAAIVAALEAADAAGAIQADDPETLGRLFIGAITRGAMLIANSSQPRRTRNAVAVGMRQLLAGLTTTR
jgi:hypothetical protein